MTDTARDHHLLVVDFDYFFPNPMESGTTADEAAKSLYDWGHAEAPFFINSVIWSIRAGTFQGFGLPLPQVTSPEGGWAAFWGRFTFTDDARATYADSNAHAGEINPRASRRGFTSIHLFDAHHDSGYSVKSVDDFLDRSMYTCEDWMLYQQLKGCFDLTVHYPQWKPNGPDEKVAQGCLTKQVVDDLAPLPVEFTDVFICRSGAWVPPWCDQDFLDFVRACPLPAEQIDDEVIPRPFDPTTGHDIAEQIRRRTQIA